MGGRGASLLTACTPHGPRGAPTPATWRPDFSPLSGRECLRRCRSGLALLQFWETTCAMRAIAHALLPAGLAAALILPFAHAQQTPSQLPFVTTCKTDAINQAVVVLLAGSRLTVHRNDGSSAGVSGIETHTYANPGTYRVSVYSCLDAISSGGHPDAPKPMSVDRRGYVSL